MVCSLVDWKFELVVWWFAALMVSLVIWWFDGLVFGFCTLNLAICGLVVCSSVESLRVSNTLDAWRGRRIWRSDVWTLTFQNLRVGNLEIESWKCGIWKFELVLPWIADLMICSLVKWKFELMVWWFDALMVSLVIWWFDGLLFRSCTLNLEVCGLVVWWFGIWGNPFVCLTRSTP